jgi:iron complex outermembrane receptor protein
MAKIFCAHFLFTLAVLGVMLGAAQARTQSSGEDLMSIDFEKLVKTEVLTASKLALQVSDSPAAVSIVTAEDIRTFGYKTLADVINGMRGLYTTYDGRYEYLGGRAFGNPGDFAGRVMILIDGYAAQDNVYGQVYIDNSALVDIELVDRVEYVPGTGSVTYGSGAFLGIINVITKNGRDFNSAQIAGDFSSYGGIRRRITAGKQLDNGANILISASDLRSSGQDPYFPYFDAIGADGGIARGQDSESNKRFFAKLQYEGLTIQAGQSNRIKDSPLPKRMNAFNRTYQVNDTSSFFSTHYEFDVNEKLKSSSHFYYGSYQDRALREFGAIDPLDQYELMNTKGQWVGFNQKLVSTRWEDQVIVLGAEYRHDFQREIGSVGLAADRTANGINSDIYSYDLRTLSLYLADEITLGKGLTTNLGLRYDRPNSYDCSQSPCIDYAYNANLSTRIAMAYAPDSRTTYKASYSEAFRLPTPSELPTDSWTLFKPERVSASELMLVHDFSSGSRFTGSLYSYRLKDIYYVASSSGAPVYDGTSVSKGLEIQFDQRWDSGAKVRTSAAWQDAQDPEGKALVNSPNLIAKFNLSLPIASQPWRVGIEGQYIGSRFTRPVKDTNDIVTREGRQLEGVVLTNLTASSTKSWHGLSVAVGIKNVFDRRYEAVSPRVFQSGSNVLDSVQMNGRTYWLQLICEFGL